MKVSVRRIDGVTFEARNDAGAISMMEGPPDLGGKGSALRPMETLLAALAGCSAVDVVKILTQQKEPLESLEIDVEGTRADAVPAVFTSIHVRFRIGGPVAANKATRAVALSVEKYCSVTKMLEQAVKITHEVVLNGVPETTR
ncbi:MAG: OsmC family protein [Polyangiaceae bacterium]|nr:OsmC family protein [Polyangiaceae bacterium]